MSNRRYNLGQTIGTGTSSEEPRHITAHGCSKCAIPNGKCFFLTQSSIPDSVVLIISASKLIQSLLAEIICTTLNLS